MKLISFQREKRENSRTVFTEVSVSTPFSEIDINIVVQIIVYKFNFSCNRIITFQVPVNVIKFI